MDDHSNDSLERHLEELRAHIGAIASAVWIKNAQGFLRLECEDNINSVGIDQHKDGRNRHNELLRQAFHTAMPFFLEPNGSTGFTTNPTQCVLMLTPITNAQRQTIGLLEAWIAPQLDFRQKKARLGLLVESAACLSEWLRWNISDQ